MIDITINRLFVFFLLVACVTSCSDGYTEMDSGLAYKILKQGTYRSPLNGEYLVLDLQMTTEDDSIIYDSKIQEMNFPIRFDEYGLKSGLVSKLHEGLFMMKEGDSMAFRVPAKLLFESSLGRAVEKGISPDETIYCYAALKEILSYDEYMTWQKEVSEKRQMAIEEERKKLFDKEVTEIDAYLNKQGIDYNLTPLGVRYLITDQGLGPMPKNGDSLFFKYDVAYFDGSPVENVGSSQGEIKKFVLGSGGVFPSWQESVRTLKKGGSGTFYIPSTLAFGASGHLGIKPNTVLVVTMELVDIK